MGFFGLFERSLPFFLSTFVVFGATAQIQPQIQTQLFNGKTLQLATPADIVRDIQPGSVVILGESHGLAAHQAQHLEVLEGLRTQGLKVSVGLEFLNYPDQDTVNLYVSGKMSEPDFLQAVKWGGIDFNFYKPQLLFPQATEGELSIALNIPRFVTSKIAKTGLESLTEDEQKLMPPNFQIGRDSYKQRFADIMHVPPGPKLDRYFISQSAWDDTMAWKAAEFLNKHPEQVLVIVVGEFHAQYGGGLADRIKVRRPGTSIVTLSQLLAVKYLEDGSEQVMTDEEIQNEMKVSETEGPRGDFIWVTKPEMK